MTILATTPDARFAAQDRCPACQGAAYDRIGPAAPGGAVEVGGRRFCQPPFEARRCRRCALVFKSAIAHADVLNDYYQRVDFRKWDGPDLYPTDRPIMALLEQLPPGSRVLDFGCGTGRLLRRVADRHRCFGVEVNPESAKIAEARGVTIVPPDSVGDNPEYAVVLMVDVFEHLTEPLAVLHRLAAAVRPGGKLVVCTGNSDAAAIRGEPALFWYFELIEHLCMLNPDHAHYLAGALGLGLGAVVRCSHYDTRWLSRVRQRTYSLAFDAFHRWRVPGLSGALGLVPKLRRVRQWTTRPVLDSSADHLVLVFEKPPEAGFRVPSP